MLRFKVENDNFLTTAVDMIHIQNDHLGYKIEFLLEYLLIDNDGSMKYTGHANFIDLSNKNDSKKIKKHRQELYIKSPKHFFEHLINNRLEEGKYQLTISNYSNGVFKEISRPKIADIVYYDSTSNHYLLSFNHFLQIKHLGFKVINDGQTNISMQQGGLESSRFSSGQSMSSNNRIFPTSFLYKITPNLIINQFGNVVNHKAIQEYGYWATQRMAHKLPLDYGIDYSTYKDFKTKKPTEPETKPSTPKNISSHSIIKDLLYGDKEIRDKTFDYMYANWNHSYLAPILDLLRINQDPYMEKRMKKILQDRVGVSNYYEGLQWMWEKLSSYDASYANAKAEIFQHIDPKFKTYFQDRGQSAIIGLDEIVWGGVNQDGIPPLRYPKMIKASEAEYLADKDVVFGVSIEGEHRAYPKRILAWHEFFVDQFGDKKIAGVYCTLCGTMIAYDMTHNGQFHNLGTSGFLYNSNKLMYDKETQSLWSTIEGVPVLGPLTQQNIKLQSYPTITTTWGEWKKMHPVSSVLSLDTGHKRNYDEGEAYKSYFAADNLMFPVAKMDNQLNNKDEVLIVRTPNFENDPLAISIKYLKKQRIYQDKIADKNILILSEKDGWSRAYDSGDLTFSSYKKGVLKDTKGNVWDVNETYLTGPNEEQLNRVPSHNSFWFAWFNAFPETRLVK